MLTPFPYQETGVDFLTLRPEASIWDEPGLGKSLQALLALKKLGLKNVLIICPASVRLVWTIECEKVGLKSTVVLKKGQVTDGINIVSYDGASNAMYDDIMTREWELLVLDEEHFLKGYNTRSIPNPNNPKRKIRVPPVRVEKIFGRNCDRKNCIAANCNRIWGLTGTPMPNNPAELYPMIRAKFPDAIMKNDRRVMSYWDFVGRYCKTFDNGFGIQITGGKNLTKLRDELRGRVMRRKKTEVAKDLPAIRYETLPVEGNLRSLPADELEMVRSVLNKPDPIKELKKMGTHIAALRRITGMAKVKSIIKWVEESGFDKVVLFAHHKAVIEELRKMDDTVYIDGSCSQGHREKAVDDFQNGDARRFVGQLQAAGTGITLTSANVLIFVEYSWVPAENRQAADRIHRIGQEDNCLVYFATVPKSVDEDIIKVVKRKLETYKEMGL